MVWENSITLFHLREKAYIFKPPHFEDLGVWFWFRTGEVSLSGASFEWSMSTSGPGPISLVPLRSQCLPQVRPEDDSAGLGSPVPVFRRP